MTAKQRIGNAGEAVAEDLLRSEGYRIIERNFRTAFGEIDLIAEEDGILCFVEVKTRRSNAFGGAAAAVTPRKQRKIAMVAAGYAGRNFPQGKTCRFDVVAVLWRDGKHDAELIRDAFRLDGHYAI